MLYSPVNTVRILSLKIRRNHYYHKTVGILAVGYTCISIMAVSSATEAVVKFNTTKMKAGLKLFYDHRVITPPPQGWPEHLRLPHDVFIYVTLKVNPRQIYSVGITLNYQFL